MNTRSKHPFNHGFNALETGVEADANAARDGDEADTVRFDIELLESDLGHEARQHVLRMVGGQRRYIPQPAKIMQSKLNDKLGIEIVTWLSSHFAGLEIVFPSEKAEATANRASELRAAVLEAGLESATRSANDIAREFGVTANWVYKLRRELRDEATTHP